MSERTAQKRRNLPTFSKERCKRCGVCTHLCPTAAIAPDEDGLPRLVDSEACTSCRLCEHVCPDFAIAMVTPDAAGWSDGVTEEDADGHPAKEPEVCHPFGACDG